MDRLFLNLAEITLSVGALTVLMLLILRTFGKRFAARSRYILWVLVVIRLCIPFGALAITPLLTLNLPEEIVTESADDPADQGQINAPEDGEGGDYAVPDSPLKVPGSVGNGVGAVTPAPDVKPPSAEPPVQNAPEVSQPQQPQTPPVAEPPAQQSPEQGDAVAKDEPQSERTVDTSLLLSVAGIVWAVSAVAVFACRFASYHIFAYRLRHSRGLREPDEALRRIYARLADEMKLKNPPGLMVCAEKVSPMLFGYFKRMIVVPSHARQHGFEEEVLRHELTHHCRGDVWIKLLCCIAGSIHWFNPLCHAAVSRCNREMELSCDERVLWGLNEEERLSYGEAMLKIVRDSVRYRAVGLTTGFNPRRSAVKERFMNIIDMSKKRRGTVLIALVAVLCIVVGAVVGCSIGDEDQKPADDDGTVQIDGTADAALPPYVCDAIRAYYGLTAEDVITNDMLESVTSVQLEYVGKADGGFYIDAAVNESGFYAYFNGFIAKDRFEKEYKVKAEEFKSTEGFDPAPYVYTGVGHSKITYESILDSDVTSESENTRRIIKYPILEKIGAMYVVNDEMAPEELRLIFKFIEDAINDGCKITASTNTLDLSSLSALPNLKYVDRPENVTVENCPVTVDRKKSDGELVFVEDNGSIVIVEYIGGGGDVVIPDTIGGLSVTEIGDRAFYKNKNIVTVTLPATVREIGTEAFYQCKKLKSIALPDGLETIRDDAFCLCQSLYEITLPQSLKWLGNNAFTACSALKSINIPASVENWGVAVFFNGGLESVELEQGLKRIGTSAFWQTKLKSVTLPEGLEVIESGAFSKTMIEEIVLPDSVKTLGVGVFSECGSLSHVTLNEGLEVIGDGMFCGTAITEITIPGTVTEVTDQSLNKAEYLEKVIFAGDAPETFVKYSSDNDQEYVWGADFTVYYNEEAEGFTSPMWYGYKAIKIGHEDEMKYHGDFGYAYTDDGGVVIYEYIGEQTEVVIPDTIDGRNVTVIGTKLFHQNVNITRVTVPQTVKTIEQWAFSYASALTDVVLNEGLEFIGNAAFGGCVTLEKINLPTSLREIGKYAFNSCVSLKEIRIPKNITEWGEDSFYGCNLEKIEFEDGLTVIGNGAFCFAKVKTLNIPGSVKVIEESAFYGCTDLAEVTLGDGVESIGRVAFGGESNKLLSITIPASVKRIHKYAFTQETLQALVFEGDAPEVIYEEGGRATYDESCYTVYYSEGAKGFEDGTWNSHKAVVHEE